MIGQKFTIEQAKEKIDSLFNDLPPQKKLYKVNKSILLRDDFVFHVEEAGSVSNEFWLSDDFEQMLCGPYDTGKTYKAVSKIISLCDRYENVRCMWVRKIKETIAGSILETFYSILPFDPREDGHPIKVYGKTKPTLIEFKNTGSMITFAGMNSPGSYRSKEPHLVYVNQAEELSEQNWNLLTARASGRGMEKTTLPQSMIIGDCNPAGPDHFIRHRKSLRRFEIRHVDNPSIYVNGQLTENGAKRMQVLQNLTGIEKDRGYYGLWVAASGVVYGSFDRNKHVRPILDGDIPSDWNWSSSIDWGSEHPFVYSLWAHPQDKSQLIQFREIYLTRTPNSELISLIKEIEKGKMVLWRVSDHDARDNLEFQQAGLNTVLAEKRIVPGIAAVQRRLRNGSIIFNEHSLAHDPDPRLLTASQPVRTIDEFSLYSYKEDEKMSGSEKDEIPIKKYDDGMDNTRYEVVWLDGYSNPPVSFEPVVTSFNKERWL